MKMKKKNEKARAPFANAVQIQIRKGDNNAEAAETIGQPIEKKRIKLTTVCMYV